MAGVTWLFLFFACIPTYIPLVVCFMDFPGSVNRTLLSRESQNSPYPSSPFHLMLQLPEAYEAVESRPWLRYFSRGGFLSLFDTYVHSLFFFLGTTRRGDACMTSEEKRQQ